VNSSAKNEFLERQLTFDCRYRYKDGFDLDVQLVTDQMCTALFGPSGSGKTTVLSLIAGVLEPDSGSFQFGKIRFGDRQWLDTEAGVNIAAEHRRVGYLFQDALLFPHLTVEKNLLFATRFRGSLKPAASVSLEQVVKVFRLEGLMNRKPDRLSGGEKQRVAFGRALMSCPDLLLMDEPVSSLDDDFKRFILTHLKDVINKFRIPVLYVTHSQQEVDFLEATRIDIHQGRIREAGN